jgi:hypothetical protein
MPYPTNVDLIANPTVSNQSYDNYFNSCVLQTNGTALAPDASHKSFVPCSNPAWQVRRQFELQSIPNLSSVLRLPWRPSWDMSLNKSFRFTESINAQVRFETFNTFNTPIFGGPNTSTSNPLFGFVVRNQSNSPRNVQLGFKLNF